MLLPFIRYFFHYIFFTKTRQRPLFLALGGLMLSSLALLVLQSVMGGLQKGLISRSQRVEGQASIIIHDKEWELAEKLISYLKDRDYEFYPEYEIELLLRHEEHISPVIVHGIDYSYGVPEFLKDKKKGGTIIGIDLAQKIRAEYLSQIVLISPSHLQSLLGDIPRQVSTTLGDMVSTGIPEVDLFHLWTRLSLVHNLIRERQINRVRIYSGGEEGKIQKLSEDLQKSFKGKVELKTWEEQNASLVWALNLETTVMVFLFVAMTLLVAISITSGFMIFFDKVRLDLVSFWILGSSQARLRKASVLFIHFISFVTTIIGLLFGGGLLWLLDSFGENLMPDIFVDRRIPVHVTPVGLLISFFVPYLISVFFSYFSLKSIERGKEFYLSKIRAVG